VFIIESLERPQFVPEEKSPLLSSSTARERERALEVDIKLLEEEEIDDR